MKGQLSAEMLIVLVIVLGLAILLATTMMKSANQAAGSVTTKTNNIANACTSNLDCTNGQTCSGYDAATNTLGKCS